MTHNKLIKHNLILIKKKYEYINKYMSKIINYVYCQTLNCVNI